jgi:hypothetical protein
MRTVIEPGDDLGPYKENTDFDAVDRNDLATLFRQSGLAGDQNFAHARNPPNYC